MKCPRCNGNGSVPYHIADELFDETNCPLCGGSGEVITNEEWLRSCPPQELMRFLMNVAYGGQIRSVQKRTFDEEAEKWSKWLKEKHTE